MDDEDSGGWKWQSGGTEMCVPVCVSVCVAMYAPVSVSACMFVWIQCESERDVGDYDLHSSQIPLATIKVMVER